MEVAGVVVWPLPAGGHYIYCSGGGSRDQVARSRVAESHPGAGRPVILNLTNAPHEMLAGRRPEMPIRFRCPHCHRLLGIARRKSGTQTNCPQCGRVLTVPVQDDKDDLDELDELLGSSHGANGSTPHEDRPPPPVPTPAPPPLPRPATTTAAPKAAPPKPPPLRKKAPAGEEPLFFTDDMDALLGLGSSGAADLDDKPGQKRKPTGGVDAMSLDVKPRNLVLSPQRATLLAVVVVVLLGLSFVAGFLIGSNR